MNKCLTLSSIFLVCIGIPALYAARVKQVCRRPATAYQMPSVNNTLVMPEQGVIKPRRQKRIQKNVEAEDTVGFLKKLDKQCLETFRDKCVTLFANGRDLDDQAYDLFVKSADILEEPEKRYASDDMRLLLEKIRKRANL